MHKYIVFDIDCYGALHPTNIIIECESPKYDDIDLRYGASGNASCAGNCVRKLFNVFKYDDKYDGYYKVKVKNQNDIEILYHYVGDKEPKATWFLKRGT